MVQIQLLTCYALLYFVFQFYIKCVGISITEEGIEIIVILGNHAVISKLGKN